MIEQVFSQDWWLPYLLITARVTGVIFLFPFFGWRGAPMAIRLWLSMFIGLAIFLSLQGETLFIPRGAVETALVLAKEVLTGLALGYLNLLFLAVFLNTGQFIDIKAGLMLSGVFEPQFGNQVTFVGQLYYLTAMAFYLAINAHHYFLQALAESFTLIPLGTGLFNRSLVGGLARILADSIRLAFQLAAPIIITLLVVDLALGLVARTVPQIHVFIEGLPLKIALALLLVVVLLPLTGIAMENFLDRFVRQYLQFMQGW